MSFQSFSFLFELISAVGVIISFIYLAVQIRQNTRAMRRAASRDIIRDPNDLNRFFIQSPDLVELHLTANEHPQELTVEERFRFQRLITYMFASFELALEYHRDGLLGDESIEAYAGGSCNSLTVPSLLNGGRQRVSSIIVRDFVIWFPREEPPNTRWCALQSSRLLVRESPSVATASRPRFRLPVLPGDRLCCRGVSS